MANDDNTTIKEILKKHGFKTEISLVRELVNQGYCSQNRIKSAISYVNLILAGKRPARIDFIAQLESVCNNDPAIRKYFSEQTITSPSKIKNTRKNTGLDYCVNTMFEQITSNYERIPATEKARIITVFAEILEKYVTRIQPNNDKASS
jgi:thymidylate kinase